LFSFPSSNFHLSVQVIQAVEVFVYPFPQAKELIEVMVLMEVRVKGFLREVFCFCFTVAFRMKSKFHISQPCIIRALPMFDVISHHSPCCSQYLDPHSPLTLWTHWLCPSPKDCAILWDNWLPGKKIAQV
jgi:hypothetical protein